MVALDTQLPNGCFGHSATQSKHRGVKQQYLSGRPSIHRRLRPHGCWFRPPPNSTYFAGRLPTTWQSSYRWRSTSNTFYPAGRTGTDDLSRRLTLFTGADPSTDGYFARSTALAIFVTISPQQVTTRAAALYAGGFYNREHFVATSPAQTGGVHSPSL